MFAWMPVIFTFMLGSFPSGLVIYWTWNNTLSVVQQSLIMKRAGVKIELWDNLRQYVPQEGADDMSQRLSSLRTRCSNPEPMLDCFGASRLAVTARRTRIEAMPATDTDAFREIGRKLFAQPCDFIWAATESTRLPPMGRRRSPSPAAPMSANPRCSTR